MSVVVPFRRRPNTDTTGSRVNHMHPLQLTSGIRIDLERTAPADRRSVVFELIDLPEHTAATLYIGNLWRPDPDLVSLLVEALVTTRIFLHLEGTPAARQAWHDTVQHDAHARATGQVSNP